MFGKQLDNSAFQIGSPGTKNQGNIPKLESPLRFLFEKVAYLEDHPS